MGVTTKTLYDTDFAEWSARTAELLRNGRLDEVDLAHVAEEIGDLGKSERRALYSQLQRIVTHLLKMRYQPEYYAQHPNSWNGSVAQGREQVRLLLKDSPSLRREVAGYIRDGYEGATVIAEAESGLPIETFPDTCPFSESDVLGE
jgi:Domain of unknown function DUF29